MAGILQTFSMIAIVLAIVFAVVAVVILIVFKIPNVIGDLSGRNAKKSIALMRKNNEKTGKKSYIPGKVNIERGKLTETIEGMKQTEDSEGTVLLKENIASTIDSEETGILDSSGTELLSDETTLLSKETEPLINKVNVNKSSSSIVIEMVEEGMLINTDEVI